MHILGKTAPVLFGLRYILSVHTQLHARLPKTALKTLAEPCRLRPFDEVPGAGLGACCVSLWEVSKLRGLSLSGFRAWGLGLSPLRVEGLGFRVTVKVLCQGLHIGKHVVARILQHSLNPEPRTLNPKP